MPTTIIKKLLLLDEEKNRKKTLEKTQLRFSGRLRWNIFIIVIIIPFIVVPFFIPTIAILAINLYFVFFQLLFAIVNVYRNIKIGKTLNEIGKKVTKLKTISNKVDSRFNFIMTTFSYKEPIEIIAKCLKNVTSLRNHEKLIVAVHFEEKTPDLNKKIEYLQENFEYSFSQLIITVHPFGQEGEIPGKCSNGNYGIRSLWNFLRENFENIKPDEYYLIYFDIDTVFHVDFLDILENTIQSEKDPHGVVWQPLLYYNWKLDELSFFTRIIGIFRSTMMAAALVTFNINVMSVFCASMRLWIDGNFVHPFYQMDDIICYIRWMVVSKRHLKIKSIYSPTLSGPTSGENWIQEFKELWIQATRWSIGSAEVFHYFMCKLKRINFFIAFIWGFNYLNYYVGILCVQNLFTIVITIKFAAFPNNDTNQEIFTYVFLGLLVLQYMINGLMIIVNKIAVNKFLVHLNVKENISFVREILHWLLTLPTSILYSFIVLYGFLSILINGKKVCKHRASKKENLI